MGSTEQLRKQIMDLKLTSKSLLQRQARNCEKYGTMDGARIYAESAHPEAHQADEHLHLDAVVARLGTQAKMTTIINAMAGSTSLSTPEEEVNNLMQQAADDYGLEVSVGLP
ncbi:hypothetical protein ACJRO7_005667 [Eucalyptus globulus]|uniref:Uncharacterized protein n=1 Tax=Eucalyptus globulus TaxID=34317 RepID=A0ABD3J3A6_EUCGL